MMRNAWFCLILVFLTIVCGCLSHSGNNKALQRPDETPTTNYESIETPTTTISGADANEKDQASSSSTASTLEPGMTRIDRTTTTTSTTPTTSSSATITSEAEGIQLKAKTVSNCIGFVIGDPREIYSVRMIGAGWIRPHPGPFSWGWIEKTEGQYDYSSTDEWVKAAQDKDIGILATLWPYADWDQRVCQKESCKVAETDMFYPRAKGASLEGIPRSRCMPCNLEGYREFVGRLVERYDGDGVDDMPGLTQPIRYWEVGNEPALRSDELTFFKGTPKEYTDILNVTYDSVKNACPDCQVVQGGMEGIDPKFTSYWDQVYKAGGGEYFDVGNIHYINNGDLANLNVAKYRELLEKNSLKKTIWVTEAEYSSDSQVDASVDGAFKAGASKVFFTRFKVGDRGPPRPGIFSPVYLKQPRKCG
jgi:hypothetical protein